MTGTFTGSSTLPEMDALDLSTVKISGAADIPGKKAKFSLDAPTVLGTKIDAILARHGRLLQDRRAARDDARRLGRQVHEGRRARRRPASRSPTSQRSPSRSTSSRRALDKLPTPPTKGADEKCGDQDCYHVTLKLTAEDLKALDPTAHGGRGRLQPRSLDPQERSACRPRSRCRSRRPRSGTVGMTFEFKYGVSVSVEAPPADQIAP